MPRKAPVCKLCRQRPATVPDRNKMPGRFVREVCSECHAGRLIGDLRYVLAVEEKRARERKQQEQE